ncbi:hypothetical protein BH09ACT10_BH09ACT10_04010 [soil metagenome]
MERLTDQMIIERILAFRRDLTDLEFAALTQTSGSSMDVAAIDFVEALLSRALGRLTDEQTRRQSL